jgi:hypothetical protein
MKIFAVVLVVGAIVAAAVGIGDRGTSAEPRPTPSPTAPASPAPRPVRDVRRSRCVAGVPICRAVRGTVIYVERVDPDGDGDAHFVLTSHQSITLPELSVIDVEKSLRPHPLPVKGDRVSAAGPVYRGSYGQLQIEAIELHVARARR